MSSNTAHRFRAHRHVWFGGLLTCAGFMFMALAIWQPVITVKTPTKEPASGTELTQNIPGIVMADDDKPGQATHTITPNQHRKTVANTTPDTTPRPDITPAKPTAYVTIGSVTYPVREYQMSAMPSDPLANQWWAPHTNISAAWDIPRGPSPTLIAVVDTGFALQHEDLAGSWFVNTGESGVAAAEGPSLLNCTDRSLAVSASCNAIDDNSDGIVDNETGIATSENPSQLNCTAQSKPLAKDCNRIDDDSNGYIDDITGWDFANGDRSVATGETDADGSGINHGTLVAGIAAAQANNTKGSAGIDAGATILPLQALDDDGFGTTVSVGNAIMYAAEQGADVINVSLGSFYPDDYVRLAIATAMQQGAVVVVSSGNDGCNCMSYPAAYPEVLAVGALDTTGLPATYSSWGTELDILAPGSQITGPGWSASNPTARYVTGNGTSFAAPLVAGLVSRVKSQQPSATPTQLMAALLETTNRMTLTSGSARSSTLGYGKVDALAATVRMTTPTAHAFAHSFSTGVSNFAGPNPEPDATFYALSCLPERSTTTVFELKKHPQYFVTLSPIDRYRAEFEGYTATTIAQACISQPHDTFEAIRSLNTLAEFRNIMTRL